MRLSCAKIVNSRHHRGGVNIRKNLLILHVIKRVQDTKNKLDSCSSPVFPDDDEDDDCLATPPLEFSVTDHDEEASDDVTDEPLAFAAEATEEESVPPPQALRKRKGAPRPAPHHKAQRGADHRVVPVLRAAVPCK